MRGRTLIGGVVGLLIVASAVVVGTGVAVGVAPTTDTVGTGLFNCSSVTGEIGFSPTTISTGLTTTADMVSIWFQAKKCKPVPGQVVKPLPKTVVGSISFLSNQGTFCPQLGNLGTGNLNLAYNFPPVPGAMIDPSVAQSATVTGGANWTITAAVAWWGSYTSATFSASLHPVVVPAGAGCATTPPTGVTSMYINHGTLTNV